MIDSHARKKPSSKVPEFSEEALQALRDKVSALVTSSNTKAVADAAGVGRSALADFLNTTRKPKQRKPHRQTIEQLQNYVDTATTKTGFVTRSQYVAIATGMNAETNNKSFIAKFSAKYAVLRAHVPSYRPLVSTLEIYADKGDNTIVRFRHKHVVPDELAFLRTTQAPIEYEGFVFHTDDRAFLLCSHGSTAQIKEIILNLPAPHVAPDKAFMGIVLTVSADQREPFAARLLVRRWEDNPSSEELEMCKPGFKLWRNYPQTVRDQFSPEVNYGLLHLNANSGLLLRRHELDEEPQPETQHAAVAPS